MRVQKECSICLNRLAMQTIDFCIKQKSVSSRKEALIRKSILQILAREFDAHKVPAVIYTKLNRKIKKLTNVPNPFKERKQQEITMARKISRKLRKNYPSTLKNLILFSACGNALDFFKPLYASSSQMQRHIHLYIDQTHRLKTKLSQARHIVFFADNAGECFFDLPLVQFLGKKRKVTYVIKSKAIQNDLTIKDLRRTSLANKFPKILCSGNDAVGIELTTISKILKKELQHCDLIIAKGMGYYETFTELPQFRGKIFYLLMAKCQPVAKSLRVPLDSYVFVNI